MFYVGKNANYQRIIDFPIIKVLLIVPRVFFPLSGYPESL